MEIEYLGTSILSIFHNKEMKCQWQSYFKLWKITSHPKTYLAEDNGMSFSVVLWSPMKWLMVMAHSKWFNWNVNLEKNIGLYVCSVYVNSPPWFFLIIFKFDTVSIVQTVHGWEEFLTQWQRLCWFSISYSMQAVNEREYL